MAMPDHPLPSNFLLAERRLKYAQTHLFASIPPDLTSMIAEQDVFKQRERLSKCMHELMNGERRQISDAACKIVATTTEKIPSLAYTYINSYRWINSGWADLYTQATYGPWSWINRLNVLANWVNIYGIRMKSYNYYVNENVVQYPTHKDLDQAAADNQLPIYRSWTKPRKCKMLIKCWLSDYCAGDKKRKRA
jgi:hypothetical protein